MIDHSLFLISHIPTVDNQASISQESTNPSFLRVPRRIESNVVDLIAIIKSKKTENNR